MQTFTLSMMVTTIFSLFILAEAGATPTGPSNQAGQNWSQNLLLNVPSLRLRVKLKGKNMVIHGQSVFDVLANPIVSDNERIYYDGFANFVDGDNTYTYMLVNGVSYMVETSGNDSTSVATRKVHCAPSILPFELILPALNNATAVPSATVGGEPVECPNGTLFQTSFSGVDFILCTSGSSRFIAYGLDVTMAAEYLPSPIHNISEPTLSDKVDSCPVSMTPARATPTTIALLTGKTLSSTTSRNLEAAAPVAIEADSCACKSTPRPCIFLHGLCNPNEMAELQDTPEMTKEKFGNIGDHAPSCTTVKYAVLNTVDYGWMNDTLQQKFCDFSLSMSETSDLTSRTISDTIVVTHSMGGLAMATALATGKCKFAESTSWVSLSASMMGSMAGDFVQDLCDDEISSIAADMLEIIGQCPPSAARKSVSYQNGKYSNTELNVAYTVAQEAYRGNVTAALCSKSYHGVLSKYSPSCLVGGMVIPHKSKENDALVEFQSCLGGLDPALFGNSYLDRFYAAKLNHADTAFLTHDGLFKDSQKPFKWFECLL